MILQSKIDPMHQRAYKFTKRLCIIINLPNDVCRLARESKSILFNIRFENTQNKQNNFFACIAVAMEKLKYLIHRMIEWELFRVVTSLSLSKNGKNTTTSWNKKNNNLVDSRCVTRAHLFCWQHWWYCWFVLCVLIFSLVFTYNFQYNHLDNQEKFQTREHKWDFQ